MSPDAPGVSSLFSGDGVSGGGGGGVVGRVIFDVITVGGVDGLLGHGVEGGLVGLVFGDGVGGRGGVSGLVSFGDNVKGDEVTWVSRYAVLGGLVSLCDNSKADEVTWNVGDSGLGRLVSLGEDVTWDKVAWVVKDFRVVEFES